MDDGLEAAGLLEAAALAGGAVAVGEEPLDEACDQVAVARLVERSPTCSSNEPTTSRAGARAPAAGSTSRPARPWREARQVAARTSSLRQPGPCRSRLPWRRAPGPAPRPARRPRARRTRRRPAPRRCRTVGVARVEVGHRRVERRAPLDEALGHLVVGGSVAERLAGAVGGPAAPRLRPPARVAGVAPVDVRRVGAHREQHRQPGRRCRRAPARRPRAPPTSTCTCIAQASAEPGDLAVLLADPQVARLPRDRGVLVGEHRHAEGDRSSTGLLRRRADGARGCAGSRGRARPASVTEASGSRPAGGTARARRPRVPAHRVGERPASAHAVLRVDEQQLLLDPEGGDGHAPACPGSPIAGTWYPTSAPGRRGQRSSL